METRVKERLTGALILVAAMVIVVPEIFSGRGRDRAAGEVPAAAPATEGPPLRTYTAELTAGSPPPAPAEPTPPAPPTPAPAPAPEPQATRPTPAPAPAPAPAETPPRPQAPSKPQAAAPTPQATPSAPSRPAPSGGWFVQVGSFAQMENAQRIAATLRKAGHDVVVLPPAGSRNLVRVRVGPVRDRAAAESLQRRLAAQGHSGAVVGP